MKNQTAEIYRFHKTEALTQLFKPGEQASNDGRIDRQHLESLISRSPSSSLLQAKETTEYLRLPVLLLRMEDIVRACLPKKREKGRRPDSLV